MCSGAKNAERVFGKLAFRDLAFDDFPIIGTLAFGDLAFDNVPIISGRESTKLSVLSGSSKTNFSRFLGIGFPDRSAANEI
jgi:hypothetical protein